MKESVPIPFPAPKPEDANSLDQPESPSRRKFLFNAGAAALISSVPAAIPYLVDVGRKVSGETIEREALEKELSNLREHLRTERDVEVDFSPIFPNEEDVSGESLDYVIEKRDLCKALIQSFDMYPPFMHKQTGLSVIRVVNDLKLYENVDETKVKSDIAGLAKSDRGVMYVEYAEQRPQITDTDSWIADKIDKVFPSSPEDKIERLKLIMHHELEHFIEKSQSIDEASYQKTTRGYAAGDKAGKTDKFDLDYLYQYELDYLSNINFISSEEKERMERRYRGFANNYGRTNGREDRASIAESLLRGSSTYSALLERAKTDLILSNKIEFLKNYYFAKSHGTMDSGYWDFLKKEDIDSESIAAYLKVRAKILSSMTDDAYVTHIERRLKDTSGSPQDFVEWKAALTSWANEGNA